MCSVVQVVILASHVLRSSLPRLSRSAVLAYLLMRLRDGCAVCRVCCVSVVWREALVNIHQHSV